MRVVHIYVLSGCHGNDFWWENNQNLFAIILKVNSADNWLCVHHQVIWQWKSR